MIACLSVPYFASAVEKRGLGSQSSDPGLVLGGQPWEPRPVYGYSREVARLGVQPGMSLRLAHILSPEALFMSAEPPKYLSASAEISDVLTDFTHLIEPEELWLYPSSTNPKEARTLTGWSRAFGRSLPARFSLDLESLPQSEAVSLAKEIGSAVRQETKLSPSIGLAENPFTAHVAATLTQPNHARTVPPGDEAQFLSSQTIHFLPLEKESARRLSVLGIRTLGQLAALPKSTLYAQFGSEFASIYQMAHGYINGRGADIFAPLHPFAEEKKERIVHSFEEPVSNLLILERVISRLAAQLAGRLQAARLEARTIRLSMEVDHVSHTHRQARLANSGPLVTSFEDTGIYTAAVTRRYPTSALRRIEESLVELLHKVWMQGKEKSDPTDSFNGVTGLSVELRELASAVSLQQLLFSRLSDFGDPSQTKDKDAAAKRSVDSITARHGNDSFFQPALTDLHHPLPERRFQMRELAAV